MGQSITVTQEMFEMEVLEPSFQRPVVVDFFATWCGPCQLLKPVLEKLAQEYDIILAKIDIDQNAQLANAYRVEGVPDVRLVMNGEVLNGFVGMLTESQIRSLFSQMGLKSTLQQGIKAVKEAVAVGDQASAQQILSDLMANFVNHPELQLVAAELAIQQHQYDQARIHLALLSTQDRDYGSRVEGLLGLLEIQEAVASTAVETPLDQTFVAGCQAALAGDYETALSAFLSIVEKDRAYRKDGARKAMLTLFNVLGSDQALTMTYRKRLMQAMY